MKWTRISKIGVQRGSYFYPRKTASPGVHLKKWKCIPRENYCNSCWSLGKYVIVKQADVYTPHFPPLSCCEVMLTQNTINTLLGQITVQFDLRKQSHFLLDLATNYIIGWDAINCKILAKWERRSIMAFHWSRKTVYGFGENKNNRYILDLEIPFPYDAIVSGDDRSFWAIEEISFSVISSATCRRCSAGFLREKKKIILLIHRLASKLLWSAIKQHCNPYPIIKKE